MAGDELSIGQIQDRPCVAMKGSLFWVWIIITLAAFSPCINDSLLLAKTVLPKGADERNWHMSGVLAEVVAENLYVLMINF